MRETCGRAFAEPRIAQRPKLFITSLCDDLSGVMKGLGIESDHDERRERGREGKCTMTSSRLTISSPRACRYRKGNRVRIVSAQ